VPLFPTTDGSIKSRRFERKRLVLWFGLAVAFHAALLLGLWLMPALRIKWEPSPDAWVHVVSVPKAQPVPPAPSSAPDVVTASKPVAAREKAHKGRPEVQPRFEENRSGIP
jgi:hypothetical protein